MWRNDGEYDGQAAKPRPLAIVSSLAAEQHGVVARRQLRARNVGTAAIDGMVRSGVLTMLHRGVYAFGHARLRDEGRCLAAVLSCGDLALLSHRACAGLRGLRAFEAGRRVDVLVVPGGKGTGKRSDHLVKVRRTRAVHRDDRDSHLGVPCTSIARTLIDLADDLPRRDVVRCAGEAAVQRKLDVDALLLAAGRATGRKGARTIAELVELHAGVPPTRSELEDAFVALVGAAGWERPVVNGRVAGFEVDFHWPRQRLVVEVHGGSYHRHAVAFERDHRKAASLAAEGWRVLAFTWRQVTGGDPLVRSAVTAALGLAV